MKRDPLLTTAQVAERLGYSSTAAVRVAVLRGYFPAPDDDGDPDAPANHRQKRWRTSTVAHALRNRPGRGRRTDLTARDTKGA